MQIGKISMSMGSDNGQLSTSNEYAQYLEIQRLFRQQTKLDLYTIDLAVLILLQTNQTIEKLGNLFFTTSQIRGSFRKAELLANQNEESGSDTRFTHCLNRLLKSNCLMRANSYDISNEDPEHILTSIGESISTFYSTGATLDVSSLIAIFDVFNAELLRIREGCFQAEFFEDWKYEERKIAIALTCLLRSVQQFQRALDIKYSEYQKLIPDLLTANTNDSIDRCKTILEWIVNTINELFEVTHSSTNTAIGILEDIDNIATKSTDLPKTIFSTIHSIAGQIESVINWVSSRHVNWVAYHGFVHTFLRNIVRIDREKRIADALARSISTIPNWTLHISNAERLYTIIENETKNIIREPKKREKSRKHPETIKQEKDDLLPVLEKLYLEEIQSGQATLSSILKKSILNGADISDVGYIAPDLLAIMVTDTKLILNIKSMVEVHGLAHVQELLVRKK